MMHEFWMGFNVALLCVTYSPPPPFFFLTEVFSNSVHFLTVLCNTFQEPKKSNNPEKTFPSPLYDGKNENLWKVLENVPS